VALGIGRAAYEGALRWARERLWSGGTPAAGTVLRPQLSRMFVLLEATQALVRSAYRAVEPAPGAPAERPHDARAARAFAAEAAFEVASEAMRLCGALPPGRCGVRFLDGSAFHPDKLLRDARTTHPTKEEAGHGPRQDP
jgi:alkylation response protein AidB-like acyl-CoA dehydrogenase